MKDREKNGALNIEFKFASFQHLGKTFIDSGLFPQPLEDQYRSDLFGLCGYIAIKYGFLWHYLFEKN